MSDLTRRTLVAALGTTPLLASPAWAATAPAIGVPSSQFQFLPTIEETVAMAKEAGFDAIEWNVRDGGHVTPATVRTELPRAVALSQKAGLATTMICTAIQDAASPHAGDILAAMQACGIRWYRSSNYFRYDYKNPDVAAQIEALRPRVKSIAELNRKYGTTILYHTHSPSGGTDLIGGNVWDLWTLLRDFDPAQVALNYDTAHTTVTGGDDWRPAAYLARRSIGGVAVKDFTWRKNPPGSALYAEDVMCPLGEGLVDLRQRFAFFKEIGFAGPINIHYEHHGMLAPLLDGVGKAKIPAPRDEFVRLLGVDLTYLRRMMRESGFAA